MTKNISVSQIKKDFPILSKQINGYDLVYLDNGASTQKPKAVIDAISNFYQNHNANIHRGVHQLSEEATESYDQSRQTVADFIGAKFEEIIFTRNTTESFNLIAYSWGLANLKKDDEILLSIAEHHSNIVPWQIVAGKTGAQIKFIDINENGELQVDSINLSPKTKVVSLTHISNVLGTINPLAQIFKKIKKYNKNILCIVDGAQSTPHQAIDVKKLHCDFFVFSGHKMCAPMGIGVLYGKKEILTKMPAFMGGGDMISSVSTQGFEMASLPAKFEAGTPNVAGAIGLAASIKYLQKIGLENIESHEKGLCQYLIKKLADFPAIKILGPKDTNKRGGLVSFYHEKIHAHDLAQVLDSVGVAVRSGHHCAMPLHKKLNIMASVRASFYFYNNEKDVDQLIKGLQKAEQIFK